MRCANPILCLTAAAASAMGQGAYTPPANTTGAHTEFTSSYEIVATPDQVVNANNTFTGGLSGARGLYKFSINSKENVICYDITLTGFRGEYSSPASTATHIHEAGPGKSGPPRIAFPNPSVVGSNTRRSVGCIQGTEFGFITGVTNTTTAQHQGFGFHVKRIEENPTAFFADVHSSEAVPGAVRGQFPLANSSSPSSSASAPGSPSSSASAPGSPSSYPADSVSSAMPTQTAPSNCTGSCPTLTKIYEDCTTTPFGTRAMPAGPTASSSISPYTGGAAKQFGLGGLALLLLGGVWALV